MTSVEDEAAKGQSIKSEQKDNFLYLRTATMEQNCKMADARGRSFDQRKPAGFVARLRSRSASMNRANRRRSQTDDEPTPPDSSDNISSNKIEDIVERHQLALKMDMVELMDAQEKETKFWRNKALKQKKRIISLEKKSGKHKTSSGQELEDVQSAEVDWRNPDQNKLIEKVSMLEKELQSRDEQIDSLRGVMDAQDRANEERVNLLENQLDRLMEVRTKERGGSCHATASTASTNFTSSDSDLTNDLSDLEDRASTSNGHDNPIHEISALEQLLARVLAEKDRLAFENDNLKSVVRETVPVSSAIVRSVPTDVVLGMAPNSNHTMYQLSHEGQHFTGNTPGKLKRATKEYYSMVWKMVQAACGEKGSTKDSDKDQNLTNYEFKDSPLAHHLVIHCRHMGSEQEVRKWCQKNVKVTTGEYDGGFSL